MTVQIPLKRNDWIFHTGPWSRPFVSWQTNPLVWTIRFGNLTILEHFPFLPVKKQRYCVSCATWQSGDDVHGFAAVICDADDPCSVNTAQDPDSSFTISPRSTTRPLYFWCFVSNWAFFKWHMSISEAKWTAAPVVLASSITSFLLLTFVRFHAEIFSNFSHSLSTAAFAAEIFMAWSIGINLWTKLQCCNEFSPFPAIWSSWWVGKKILPYAILWIHWLPKYTQVLIWRYWSFHHSHNSYCSCWSCKA